MFDFLFKIGQVARRRLTQMILLVVSFTMIVNWSSLFGGTNLPHLFGFDWLNWMRFFGLLVVVPYYFLLTDKKVDSNWKRNLSMFIVGTVGFAMVFHWITLTGGANLAYIYHPFFSWVRIFGASLLFVFVLIMKRGVN